MEIRGVAVDPECAGRGELVPAIAAREQANAQHPGAPRGEEIPHGVADHVAVADLDAQLLLTPEKEVGFRFRAQHVAAVDDDGLLWNAERNERAIDLRTAPGCGDPVRNLLLAQPAQKLDRAGEGAAVWEKLAEKLAVPCLDPFRVAVAERPPDLTRNCASKKAPAHPDTPVDLPAIDRESGFRQGALPREDVRVDGVDERSVEIENERTHGLLAPRLPPRQELTAAKGSRRLRPYIWSDHLTRGFFGEVSS